MKNIKSWSDAIIESQNQKDLNDMLRHAVGRDNVKMASRAIAAGADVNSQASSALLERTPLHDAVEWNKVDMVKLLIRNGARLDVQDAYGLTPLHLAARMGSTGLADILLKAGAPVNARSTNGETPLMAAKKLSTKHRHVAELLILRGADPLSAFSGLEEIIEFFDGDISWMPEALRLKLKRMQKGKQAFGM